MSGFRHILRMCAASTTSARRAADLIVAAQVYDVKVVDRLVTRVAREIRLLEQALKATNAKTPVEAYNQDDTVLGELS